MGLIKLIIKLLVLPLIVRTITTRATYDVASLTVPFVLMMGGVYMLLRIIDAAANYYMQSIGHIMGSQLETDMRHDIFQHLQELSFGYYSDTKVGQIMARITSDLFEITEFAHHCPEEFFIAGIKIVASFVILCRASIPLTLAVFACVPLMGVVSVYLNGRLRARFRQQRVQIGELNSTIEDSLLGQGVVKAFAAEDEEREKFARGNRAFEQIKTLGYYAMGAFNTSTRLFDGLIKPILDDFEPELIINSAGQDNHFSDPLASMSVTAHGYAALADKLKADIAVLEGGYSIEAALPYVNTGIILAMAEMDYSNVIEPDISALRRPDPRCMTRVEQLIEQVGNIWRTRREVGRMLLDKCGGKWQRRKGIYYDEEGIREEQLETAHYCKNCSGYITVATNARGTRYGDQSAYVVCLLRDTCETCKKAAYDDALRAKQSCEYKYILLQHPDTGVVETI